MNVNVYEKDDSFNFARISALYGNKTLFRAVLGSNNMDNNNGIYVHYRANQTERNKVGIP